MPLEALIFDVDGTLAETEEVHRASFNEAFVVSGLAWCWSVERYMSLLKTAGGKERIRAYASQVGQLLFDEDVAAIHEAKTERYVEKIAAGTLGPRPGIAALIEDVRRSHVRLAIATTTSRPNVDALVRSLFGEPAEVVFEVIAAGDEVATKKPAPDVYLLALERLGLPAAACVAFEDSANGVNAALAAGIRTVVAPGKYTLEESFPSETIRLGSFSEVASLSLLQQSIAMASVAYADGRPNCG